MHVSRAEAAVLGSVLLRNEVWAQASILREHDFSLPAHRKLFQRIRDLAESGKPIDATTLCEELERHGELSVVGGLAYVIELVSSSIERTDISHLVDIVREQAIRRIGEKTGERLQKLAGEGSVSLSAMADEAGRFAVAAVVGSAALPPRNSEEAITLRFSHQHREDLRYVARWGHWMFWDGTRWREDDTLAVFDRARSICRTASSECGDAGRDGVRLASKATVAAVERLAQADRRHAATVDQWDADHFLLNTPRGTVDLRNGIVHEHKREQYLTKLTAAGPGGECPLWLKFLDRITNGDTELQAFLQRIVGYCLTGSPQEHALFFFYGTGSNGKSVFLSTISGLLGDYAKTAPASAFTATNNEQHPTDLAGLRGARFVTAIETEDGRCWAEAKIKSLTGGDRITARFMRKDFFEYVPQFKLVIAGNHKPGLRSVDEAIRRRFFLIPFTVTISREERDPELAEKLKAEYPGILRWAIEGCLQWQQDGLNPPTIVLSATSEYLEAEDALGRFLGECCVLAAGHWSAGAVLYEGWQRWCAQTGERPRTQKWFAQALQERGIKAERCGRNGTRGFSGIALRRDVLTHPTGPHI